MERDIDCAGDQPFFSTSELGFDESKLIDVGEARKKETIPFVQGDRERRFHEFSWQLIEFRSWHRLLISYQNDEMMNFLPMFQNMSADVCK